MINQLTNRFILTNAQRNTLSNMLPFNREDWESNTNAIIEIRTSINNQLRRYQQGKCCYCGLIYDETGRGEIEHIAPKKGRIREYPEFSFHELNLAISCQLCNSSTMKGEYNPIINYNIQYQNCTFSIVHPYLHNHNDHYRWSFGLTGVIITAISNEGRESIRLFKLDGEHRTSARAKQNNHEKLVLLLNIPQNTLLRIKRVINFRIY
jgi:uncharacterized protein (TIGR02646 family)